MIKFNKYIVSKMEQYIVWFILNCLKLFSRKKETVFIVFKLLEPSQGYISVEKIPNEILGSADVTDDQFSILGDP